MTDLARLAEEYRAGWSEGYRHGFNEGLSRAFPPGYDVGTPENPCLQFTNVIVQSGEIIDEACLCRRKHNPASARAHACMLLRAADVAEATDQKEVQR